MRLRLRPRFVLGATVLAVVAGACGSDDAVTVANEPAGAVAVEAAESTEADAAEAEAEASRGRSRSRSGQGRGS